ncbi:hypothetical protein AB3K78_01160 [Leucobacter sp. HNU]|uniref:hypothetical protein n=1 Tax=Leucobacter sp. HNU TaxID=3236805 RepID=UPI003A7F9EE4
MQNGAGIAAGLGAILAALIAFHGISRQIGQANQSLAQAREANDQASWWRTFEWAAERVAPSKPGTPSLSPHLLMGTLSVLRDSAPDEAQQRACSSLVDHVALVVETNQAAENTQNVASKPQPNSGKQKTESSESANAMDALMQWIHETSGKPSASPKAIEVVSRQKFTNSLVGAASREKLGIAQAHGPSLRSVGSSGYIELIPKEGSQVRLSYVSPQKLRLAIDENFIEESEVPEILVTSSASGLIHGMKAGNNSYVGVWNDPLDTPKIMNLARTLMRPL